MEIRRFGPGHRRPDGPPGTSGITGQVIWNDRRANVSELAFSRRAAIAPHENPNTTLFIVVSGGGFVQIGDERTRINHGEAVVWPAGIPHGASTDGSEMRAILVELSGPDDDPMNLLDTIPSDSILDAAATPVAAAPEGSGPDPLAEPGTPIPVEPARGSLAERPPRREDHDESEGEPW